MKKKKTNCKENLHWKQNYQRLHHHDQISGTWKRYKVKEKLFICICPWINPMTSAKENQGVCCCLSVCPFIAFSPQVISVPLTMFENHSKSLISFIFAAKIRIFKIINDTLRVKRLNTNETFYMIFKHSGLYCSPKKTGFSAADLRRTIISKGTAIQHLSFLIYKFSHQWFPKLILLHWHFENYFSQFYWKLLSFWNLENRWFLLLNYRHRKKV